MKKPDTIFIDLITNNTFYSLFISYQPIYFTKCKRSVSGKFPCATGISTLTSVCIGVYLRISASKISFFLSPYSQPFSATQQLTEKKYQ